MGLKPVAVFLACLAVIGVSASGPLMAAIAAPALAIAFWRNLGATVLLTPMVALDRRVRTPMVQRDRVAIVVAGLCLAVHFAAWISSLKFTSVASATALCMTQLLWVVLIDRIRGVRIAPLMLLGVALSVVGVLVVAGVDFTLSARALGGDVLAVLGGLFAGLYFIAGQSVRGRIDTTRYAAWCFGVCAVALAVACLAFGVPLAGFSRHDWLLIASVAVVAQFMGHSLLNLLLASMGPTRISMLLLVEVPGAALLAAWFLHQSPQRGVYAGLGLILAGLAVVTAGRPPQAPPDL